MPPRRTAAVDGITQRLPYSGDPVAREKINRGEVDYLEMHLSQVAPMAWEGVLGPLDTTITEVSGNRVIFRAAGAPSHAADCLLARHAAAQAQEVAA